MRKFLNEFSKIALVVTFVYGIMNGVMYWVAILSGFEPEGDIISDTVKMIVAPFITYCTLQLGLKSSLNKNGLYIDSNGDVSRIDKKNNGGGN